MLEFGVIVWRADECEQRLFASRPAPRESTTAMPSQVSCNLMYAVEHEGIARKGISR